MALPYERSERGNVRQATNPVNGRMRDKRANTRIDKIRVAERGMPVDPGSPYEIPRS